MMTDPISADPDFAQVEMFPYLRSIVRFVVLALAWIDGPQPDEAELAAT